MPQYDFRCEECGQRFSLHFRRYADYDRAAPGCPQCGGLDVARVIAKVSLAGLSRDYSRMSSGEMLSVLESGDRGQVSQMFEQVTGQRDSAKDPAGDSGSDAP